MATEDEVTEELSVVEPDCSCSVPILNLNSDILEAEPLSLLTEDTYVDSLLTVLPVRFWSSANLFSILLILLFLEISHLLLLIQVLTEEEQHALAATPAHPRGLYGKISMS